VSEPYPYPVYEKDGLTQIAPNAESEVRLRFNGWRKQRAEVEQPPPADPPAPADPPRERPKPRNRPADQ
jgi:hypothetical protein